MDDDPEEGEEDARAPHHQTVQLQTPTTGGEGRKTHLERGGGSIPLTSKLCRTMVKQMQGVVM